MLTSAKPIVTGRRILVPAYRTPIVVGIFSCHLAAVSALYRYHRPDSPPLVPMTYDDTQMEYNLRARISAVLGKKE